MDRHSERFLTAFEEVTSAALGRPGGVRNEERVRAVWRAVEDGLLDRQDAEHYQQLKAIRDSIVHDRHDGQLLVRATPASVAVIEAIREKLIGTEPTVWSLCGEVTIVSPSSTISGACQLMRTHDYSTLPVITDAGLHGLLSANDLVWWIGGAVQEQAGEAPMLLEVLDDVVVSDVMHAHTSVDYALVERRFPVRDLPGKFATTGRSGCPIGAVLITANGQPHEPLSGIVTPWDLAELH